MFGLDKIAVATDDAPLGSTSFEFTYDPQSLAAWVQERLGALATVAQTYKLAVSNLGVNLEDDLQQFRSDFITALRAEVAFWEETEQDIVDFSFTNVSINGATFGDIFTAQTGQTEIDVQPILTDDQIDALDSAWESEIEKSAENAAYESAALEDHLGLAAEGVESSNTATILAGIAGATLLGGAAYAFNKQKRVESDYERLA